MVMKSFVAFSALATILACVTNAAHLRPRRQVMSRNLAPYYVNTDLGETNLATASDNPLKGLVPSPRWLSPPYVLPHSLEFYYVGMDEVLIGPNQTDWTVIENILAEADARRAQAIIRFFVDWPGQPLRLPLYLIDAVELRRYERFGGGVTPYFGDPDLLAAMEYFIKDFGAKFDGDVRLPFVQTGILGWWGEWHTSGYEDTFIPDFVKTLVIDWFDSSFKRSQVQTRNAFNRSAELPTIGYHDDSFGKQTLDGHPYNGGFNKSYYFWPRIIEAGIPEFWETAVMGGETRPEWQEIIFEPDYPARTEHHQSFKDCTDVTHTTYMIHHKLYVRPPSGEELENTLIAHAYLGYAFKIEKVEASASTSDGKIDVAVEVAQVGQAPFYFDLSLVLNCDDLTSPIRKGGVETLIEKYMSETYVFEGVPTTSACLRNIEITLESSMMPPANRIRFAQGNNDGRIMLNIPMPDGTEPLPAPTPIEPVPAPATTEPVPAPTPTEPAPTPTTDDTIHFELYNADTDSKIASLTDGDTVNLDTVGTSLTLVVSAPNASRVTMKWMEGTTPMEHSEGAAPFVMGGNTGSDYFAVDYLGYAGEKSVTAEEIDSSGAVTGSKIITFTIVDGVTAPVPAPTEPAPTPAPTQPAPAPTPTEPAPTPTTDDTIGFELYNADTDSKISSLTDGDTVNLATVGTSLTLVVSAPNAQRVNMKWMEGTIPKDHSEGAAPFVMGGNSGSNYFEVAYLSYPGLKSVTAEEEDSSGAVTGTKTITFTVVDGVTAPVPAPTEPAPAPAPTEPAPAPSPTGPSQEILLTADSPDLMHPDLNLGTMNIGGVDKNGIIVEAVEDINSGAWIAFPSVDLSGMQQFEVSVKTRFLGGGWIDVREDALDGELVGSLIIPTLEGEWKVRAAEFSRPVSGVHDLYFVFRHDLADFTLDMFELEWIKLKADPFIYTSNPFITNDRFSDPSAHVWSHDPDTIWVYAAHDPNDATGDGEMDGFHAFSSKNMKDWTDHGMALHHTNVQWGQPLWMRAPDVCYRNGKYYMYYSHKNDVGEHRIGVAISDAPQGPFVDTGNHIPYTYGYDPSCFEDDDGQFYLLFAQHQISLLKENMIEVVQDWGVDIQFNGMVGDPGYTGGAWMHKRNGVYYYSWTRKHSIDDFEALYAIGSTSPFGPYDFMGSVGENTYASENHHSIAEFKGNWYFFYHRPGPGVEAVWRRMPCVETISYNSDGTIQEIHQTEFGVPVVY